MRFVTSDPAADVSKSSSEVGNVLAAAPFSNVEVVSTSGAVVTEGLATNVDGATAEGVGAIFESVKIPPVVAAGTGGAVAVPAKPGRKDGT
jgi:hypothetical protein